MPQCPLLTQSGHGQAPLDKIKAPAWCRAHLFDLVMPSRSTFCGNSLLQLSCKFGGGKLLAHRSGRIADSLDRTCKLLLSYTQMPGPVPYLIFTVQDNLAAVASDTCVFHGPSFSVFPRPLQRWRSLKQQKNLRELFHDTQKDIYFAEKKILIALPKMAKGGSFGRAKGSLSKA